MEKCEDIRHTIGMKEVYVLRKETAERLFGTAKENGSESRAYVCLHESEKTGKDDSQEGKKGSPKVFIIDQVHTF